jgi:CheY-specific phosphatase CheX|eukprot:COSAG02_NODE_694_length_18422_cov_19.850188_9_plen_107_part_00
MAINIEGTVHDLLTEKLALRLSAKLMSGIVRVYAMKENQLGKIAQDASNEMRKKMNSAGRSSTTLPKDRQVLDAFAKIYCTGRSVASRRRAACTAHTTSRRSYLAV